MVGHQHPSVYIYPVSIGVFGKPGGIGYVILIRSETDLAIVAALDDMNRNIDW